MDEYVHFLETLFLRVARVVKPSNNSRSSWISGHVHAPSSQEPQPQFMFRSLKTVKAGMGHMVSTVGENSEVEVDVRQQNSGDGDGRLDHGRITPHGESKLKHIKCGYANLKYDYESCVGVVEANPALAIANQSLMEAATAGKKSLDNEVVKEVGMDRFIKGGTVMTFFFFFGFWHEIDFHSTNLYYSSERSFDRRGNNNRECLNNYQFVTMNLHEMPRLP